MNFYETYHELPVIYLVTPTHYRETQLADLTAVINTLWLVPKIFWIIIEDAPTKSYRIGKLLNNSKIEHVHLNVNTPDDMRIKPGEKPWAKPRGVLQRNEGLKWLRDNANEVKRGVLYFLDDDNTYDIRLFEEVANFFNVFFILNIFSFNKMRYTKKVSVWPVAFVGELMYEKPIWKNGKVYKFYIFQSFFKNKSGH